MNERIKQLLKQARNITAENHVPGGSDYEREIYVTFAELIVRDCAMISRSTKCEDIDGGAVMRQRFGLDKPAEPDIITTYTNKGT